MIPDNLSVAAPRRVSKSPSDTVAGCTAMAAADLTRSLTMDTANGRLRFEHSAAAWTARADLLHRIERDSEARKAAVLASGCAEPALA